MRTTKVSISLVTLLLILGAVSLDVQAGQFTAGVERYDCNDLKREIKRNWLQLQSFYDPEAKRCGGEIARWQQGGYDMDYRMQDAARERIDMQFIFPTQIDIAAQTAGEQPAAGVAAAAGGKAS